MKEYLIGTGGWAYYHIPSLHPLVAYSRAFNFVEVNTTFYQIPSVEEAKRWRQLVPQDFRFAVRAHRNITHTHKLQPTKQALDALEKMTRICSILEAEALHLQTPPSFKFTRTLIAGFADFLDQTNLGRTRLALEVRGNVGQELPVELVKAMQDHDVIHCVDLSKGEMPAYESNVLYSRLFGKGKHNVYQPSDEELVDIDRRGSASNAEKVIMSFHFVRMYKDAARLHIYRQTGKFPQITSSTGLSSLEEVLNEDASFPTTKQELISHQGWKLFDATRSERTHASDLLQKLPDKTYSDISDVINTLHSTVE